MGAPQTGACAREARRANALPVERCVVGESHATDETVTFAGARPRAARRCRLPTAAAPREPQRIAFGDDSVGLLVCVLFVFREIGARYPHPEAPTKLHPPGLLHDGAARRRSDAFPSNHRTSALEPLLSPEVAAPEAGRHDTNPSLLYACEALPFRTHGQPPAPHPLASSRFLRKPAPACTRSPT